MSLSTSRNPRPELARLVLGVVATLNPGPLLCRFGMPDGVGMAEPCRRSLLFIVLRRNVGVETPRSFSSVPLTLAECPWIEA
jgi:hypothetical protein